MKNEKFRFLSFLLIPICLFIYYLFSLYPYEGEFFYSLNLNKSFIKILSTLTGVLPFSLAELILYSFIFLCLFYILYTLRKLFHSSRKWFTIVFHFILNSLTFLSILYFLFMSMWGFNYLRPHFTENIGASVNTHTTDELASLYTYLIHETNKLSQQTLKDADGHMMLKGGYQNAFKRASLGYNEAAKIFPSLGGSYGPPKPLLLSKLINYTGLAGIYSPFTGEANVNIALLDHAIPSTTMHEMAHQRGYANEDECNFISFLSCSLHPDIDFKYSGYLLALSYTSSALAKDNMKLLTELSQNLSPAIMQDIENNNEFVNHYDGAVEAFSTQVNDTYLKANGISDGQKSYGRMVDLLLSYYSLSIQK